MGVFLLSWGVYSIVFSILVTWGGYSLLLGVFLSEWETSLLGPAIAGNWNHFFFHVRYCVPGLLFLPNSPFLRDRSDNNKLSEAVSSCALGQIYEMYSSLPSCAIQTLIHCYHIKMGCQRAGRKAARTMVLRVPIR